jgi:hypothetical protein
MPTISTNLGNPQATDVAVETALPFIGNVSREDLQSTLGQADAEISKLYEDRNVLLTQGGQITYSGDGTELTFGESLKLEINSQVAGGTPTVITLIIAGSYPSSFTASGNMIYAVVDRTGGTATVTYNATTLPAVVNANQEVFLIAKRDDAAGPIPRCYFRDGTVLNAGQTARLGQTSGISNLSLLMDGEWSVNSSTLIAENLTASTVNVQSTVSTEWSGQGFTATQSGSITSVQVQLVNGAGTGTLGGNIVGQLWTNSGGLPGTLIATGGSVAASGIGNSLSTFTFTFSSVPLVSGTSYFFVMDFAATTYSGGADVYAYASDSAPYGGRAVISTTSGSSWISQSPEDIWFIASFSGALLSWTEPAYVQVPGLANNNNTIPTSESPVTFTAAGQVAYVELNTTTGSSANLTVNVVDDTSLVPDSNTYIVATFDGSTVLVGGNILLTVGVTGSGVLLGGSSWNPGAAVAPSTVGNVLTSTGSTWASQAPANAPTSSYELVNLGLSSSVASNALTINLTQYDGASAPTSGNPVSIGFRSSTATSAAYSVATATSATSITLPNGASLGVPQSGQYIYVYAVNSAGTISLAACGTEYPDEGSLVDTVSISGSATDPNTLYSGSSGLSNVPARLIGRVLVNETVAGTYASAPTEMSLVPFINKTPYILTATSSSKTASASSEWQDMVNGSVTVGAGTWKVTGSILWDFATASPEYQELIGQWSSTPGTDSAAAPTGIEALSNITLLTVFNAEQEITGIDDAEIWTMNMQEFTMVVQPGTDATVYLVPFSGFAGNAANTRISTFINAQKIG